MVESVYTTFLSPYHILEQKSWFITIVFGLLLPFLVLSMAKMKGGKKLKVRGVTVEAGGEPGLTKRNHRFL
eukprot:c33997_g1_i1 orf=103-315(+)